jgi:transposase
LGRNILRVYELTPERARLDATTISDYHAGGDEESLFQYGYSKDDLSLRQVKLMVAALDPLGLPLVTQVVAGDTADDNLYKPAIERVLQIIDGIGLLFVGDSKMSALAIRAYIHSLNQHYLCPLAQTGATAQEMEKWIEAANDGTYPLQPVYVENAKGERRLLSLTPPPARGKRQIQEESDLVNAANTILKAYEAEH